MATLTHYGSTHVTQLEANLARIAHESAARDRQMSQVSSLIRYLVTYLPADVAGRAILSMADVIQLLEHVVVD